MVLNQEPQSEYQRTRSWLWVLLPLIRILHNAAHNNKRMENKKERLRVMRTD